MDRNIRDGDTCQSMLAVSPDDAVDSNLQEPKCHQNVDEKSQSYLSAAVIMNIRHDPFKGKHKDEEIEIYKGPKLYAPASCNQDEILKNALDNYKNTLKLQRVAKIKDCMKAEWLDDLRISVVASLKGKTTQHMGRNHQGKIALSPEESIYLLEKNNIEIKHNNMPLSIEEAYSVMLKGKLGLEKYQVYSHLSQQGFVVVHHQSRIGLDAEKVLSKKRKAVNGLVEEPKEKRITFSGVLASNSQATASEPVEESIVRESEVFPDANSASDAAQKPVDDAASSDGVSLKVSEEVSSSACAVSDSTNITESSDRVAKEAVQGPSADSNRQSGEVSGISMALNSDGKTVSSLTSDEVNKVSLIPVNEVSDALKDVAEKLVLQGVDDTMSKTNGKEPDLMQGERIQSEQNQVAEQTADAQPENNVDKLKEVTVSERAENNLTEVQFEDDRSRKYSEIDVEDSSNSSVANDVYEESNQSMLILCEDSSEDLDVISCSVSDVQSSYDGCKSVSNDICRQEDEEVTLVEVKKKENKPLAVIDLLSDDDAEDDKQNTEEIMEGSDDEIQVVKVCPKTTNRNFSRNSSSVKSECKPNLSIVKGSVDIKSYRPQMQFPNLFRKDMYCIPRPLPTLLPSRVRPAKEVYIINCKKPQQNQGRVWESFRDLQDYQRDRRIQRQMGQPERSFSSLRDFRLHRDSCSPRNPPFAREEAFRKPDFERNNHTVVFQQNRDPMYPTLNHQEHSSPLLSHPDPFNPPNASPFMDMHSVHSMSNPNPAFIVNEIHRTIHSVTSNIIHRTIQSVTNSILGPSLSHLNPMSGGSPTFNTPPPAPHLQFNSYSQSSPLLPEPPPFNSFEPEYQPDRFPPDPMFPGDRALYGNYREPQLDSWTANMRRRNNERKGPMFPRAYKDVRRKRCWSDIKSSECKEGGKSSDSGSDIEEVPINLNQFLWSNDIQPLVKPGSSLPVSEVLRKLRITRTANLLREDKTVDSSLLKNSLEISFDVYLPGFKYKKSAPAVPKLRIVVLRSTDPIPRYSEIVLLKKQFSDSAVLQMAVVDHGDISFYSFNSVSVPDLVPFTS